MFGNYFQGQPFPPQNLWWNYGLFRRLYLASNKPEKCQVLFPHIYTSRLVHTLVHLHGSVQVWRGRSGTLASQKLEFQKVNYTIAHRLSLLTPTWYNCKKFHIPQILTFHPPSGAGRKWRSSPKCVWSVHLDFFPIQVFLTSKRGSVFLRRRQWRYSKHVMEPPIRFTSCPIFSI